MVSVAITDRKSGAAAFFRERVLAPLYLGLCIVLGGASAGGFAVNGALQVLGLAIIVFLSVRGFFSELTTAARSLLWIAAAAAIYLVLSLIPLPPAVWTSLAGRAGIAHGFSLLGMAEPALGISLNPDGTVRALLSFLPPVAMFLATFAASPRGRRDLLLTLCILAVGSILFGVVQMRSGPQSGYYLYYFTSRGGAVGFFANRNHLATLCLMTMPLLTALIASSDRLLPHATRFGRRIIGASGLLFLTLGVGVVQSLAGWLLLLPTWIGCLIIYNYRRRASLARYVLPIGGLVLIAAIGVALFAPIAPVDLNKTSGEINPQLRRAIMSTTLKAVGDYAPVGSGFGSFVEVYPRYENVAQIQRTFINHAHDDYLELLLEGGVPGLLLLIAFLGWAGMRAKVLWSPSGRGRPLGRAASVALCVLLAHSFVDYPFRTAAVAAVAAIACALMSVGDEALPVRKDRRTRSNRTIMLAEPLSAPRSPPLAKPA